MKLVTEPRQLETEGIKESLEFAIEVTPQAMEVLSGLYSDIPWAIVREYGTNMLDAYVKLPPSVTRRPPQLHVPNNMEPWIEFKDFGVGMDANTLRTIFTRYFASTKRDNNEEVGGLGLGAKTAFCYEAAESWVVESRFNGTKIIFHATKNEQHIPTLNHVGDFPTDEPNGVTVNIPVAQSDIGRFKTACERLIRYFPMPIEVVGAGPGFNPKPLEYVLRGKTWGLRRRKKHGDASFVPTHYAIMGNVPYPIVVEELRRHTKFDHRFLPTYGEADWALDIWVPVGALRTVPSREALMYTNQTRKGLAHAVDEFVKELPTLASAEIKTAPTKWEAIKQMRALFKSPLSEMLGNVDWHGQKLDLASGIQVPLADLPKGIKVMRIENESRKCVFRERTKFVAPPKPAAGQPTEKPTFISDPGDPLHIRDDQVHFLFVDDQEKGGFGYVRAWMLDQCTEIQSWGSHRRYWKDDGRAYVFEFDKDALAAAKKQKKAPKDIISALFGGAPVQTTTELQVWHEAHKDKQTKAPIRTRRPTKVRVLDKSKSSYGVWEETEVDTALGGFYVGLDRDTILSKMPTGGHLNTETVGRAWTNAIKAGLIVDTAKLYGIPRSCQTLERKPGWQDVVQYIATKLNTDLDKREWVGVLTWRTWEETVDDSNLGDVLLKLLQDPPTSGKSAGLWKRFQRVIPDIKRTRALSDLAEFYQLQPPTDLKADHNGKEEYQRLLQTYPMLAVLADCANSDIKKHVTAVKDYLNNQ